MRLPILLFLTAALGAQAPIVTMYSAQLRPGFNPGPMSVRVQSWPTGTPSQQVNIPGTPNTIVNHTASLSLGGATVSTNANTKVITNANGDWDANLTMLTTGATPSGQTRHTLSLSVEVFVTPQMASTGQILPTFVREFGWLGVLQATVSEINASGTTIGFITFNQFTTNGDSVDRAHHAPSYYTVTSAPTVLQMYRIDVYGDIYVDPALPTVNVPRLTALGTFSITYRANSQWLLRDTLQPSNVDLTGGWGTWNPSGANPNFFWSGQLDCNQAPSTNFTAWLFINTTLTLANLGFGHKFYVNPSGASVTFLPWTSNGYASCSNYVALTTTLPLAVPPPGAPLYSQILFLHSSGQLTSSAATPMLTLY